MENARICSLDKKECTNYYYFKFFTFHLKLTNKIQSFNKEIKNIVRINITNLNQMISV